MSTLKEIESAIETLPREDRWNLFHHLQDRLWADWDRQIEDDAGAGKFDSLISELKSDISEGRLRPLNQVIDHP